MTKQNYLLQYEIDINKELIKVNLKNFGKIGDIFLIEKFNMYCFFPIKNFFYKPIYLALILNKLNQLNDYKKEDKHV